MTQESLTEKLGRHIARPVNSSSKQRARLHLLDWLGCVAGARGTANGKRLIAALDSPSAYLGNVLEMDDVHRSAILHPGPVIWPTALSGANDMESMLTAAVRGYEAMIAVGATFDAHHYAQYHPTATAGVFGAVAARWSVHSDADNADEAAEMLVHAFGLAGTLAGGLWQTRHENDDAKQYHSGRASANGMMAFDSAARGLRGPRYILEGAQGLYAATCKLPQDMILNEGWQITNVSFKPWGACRHAHPAIDAALELKAKLGALNGEITVESYADAVVFCDRADPKTVGEAKFSIQHAVAVVAEKGVPELADFEPNAIAEYADARGRVCVKEASDITRRYPQHYGARISCGGDSVELIDALGDPERPMDEGQIIDKARALIAWGGLQTGDADRAVHLALESNDCAEIAALLGNWL